MNKILPTMPILMVATFICSSAHAGVVDGTKNGVKTAAEKTKQGACWTADKTKQGVCWTANKTKQGASWTVNSTKKMFKKMHP